MDAVARFNASKDALKVIYYVIIGIAITESLNRVFLDQSAFVGMRLLDPTHLPSLILLVAFLPTVSRFVHGASIHLDVIHTGSFKALVDFSGFFLQASLFYLMAVSIDNAAVFILLLAAMLIVDAAWLIVLRCMGYIDFAGTEKQWIASDAVILLLLLAVWWFDPSLASMASAIVILASLWIAAIVDYHMNREFYFPVQGSIGS